MSSFHDFVNTLNDVLVYEDYKPNNDEGEVAHFCRLMQNKDLEGALSFVGKKVCSGYLEMEHPQFSGLVTRARVSLCIGATNFIFFSDRNDKNWWGIAQLVSFINAVLLPGKVLKLQGFAPAIKSSISNMKGFADELDVPEFDNSSFKGFLLSFKGGPFHFFYDHLYPLWRINKKNLNIPVFHGYSYIDPVFVSFDSLEYKKTDSGVFVYPCAIERNILKSSNMGGRPDVMDMEECIVDILDFEDDVYSFFMARSRPMAVHDKKTITLWIGVTGEKRCWVGQQYNYYKIVEELLKYYMRVRVYVDGKTSPHSGYVTTTNDDSVYSDLCEKLGKFGSRVDVKNYIGATYQEKVSACSECDVFITDSGTASFVPLRLCNKPGVIHSNKNLFTFPGSYSPAVKRVHPDNIFDVKGADGSGVPPHKVSYSINWGEVFNLLVDVLNNLGCYGVDKVDVLTVECCESVGEKEILSDISKKIRSNLSSPDVLREIALTFELLGDFETAFLIMQKAKLLRPNGPVINRKLSEYESRLKLGC